MSPFGMLHEILSGYYNYARGTNRYTALRYTLGDLGITLPSGDSTKESRVYWKERHVCTGDLQTMCDTLVSRLSRSDVATLYILYRMDAMELVTIDIRTSEYARSFGFVRS